MSNFLGKGEKTTLKILLSCIGLKERHHSEMPYPGIYPQTPLIKLIGMVEYADLKKEMRKSTVDFLIITNHYQKIIIRVNGKKNHGQYASVTKDPTIKFYLEENKSKVIDLNYFDNPILFEEIYNGESINEVFYWFKKAGLDYLFERPRTVQP